MVFIATILRGSLVCIVHLVLSFGIGINEHITQLLDEETFPIDDADISLKQSAMNEVKSDNANTDYYGSLVSANHCDDDQFLVFPEDLE